MPKINNICLIINHCLNIKRISKNVNFIKIFGHITNLN